MEKQLRVLQDAYNVHISNLKLASRNPENSYILRRCLQTHEIFERTVTSSFILMQRELLSENINLRTLMVKAIAQADTMQEDIPIQVYVPLSAEISQPVAEETAQSSPRQSPFVGSSDKLR